MIERVLSYFVNLGFYPSVGNDFHLGPSEHKFKRTLWEISVYLLLALGIVCREMIEVGPLNLNLSVVNWNMAGAAFVIAAMPFPVIIRKLTAKKPEGGLTLILTPFAYGLAVNWAAKFVI